MKILIAGGEYYGDRPSGSSRIALDEAVALALRGQEVWMLASAEPSLPEHAFENGVHVLRYAPAKISNWNPARAFSRQKAARAILQRHLPVVDAIHGHLPLEALAALDFYGPSVHTCYTVHSPASMELAIVWRNSTLSRRMTAPAGLMIIKRIEAECLRRSQVITALSQYTISCIDRVHGREISERVKLIPGWVDTSRFVPAENRDHLRAQLGWPSDIPILFTLRRLESRMGLDRLLDASHRLLGEGFVFRLMIGGSGSLRGRLEEQTKTLGLSNSVTFLGRIDDRQLPLAYAACDAFVLPTAELECFGLIALEALSAGRPVLATPIGAIPEIISKIESSWLARSAEVPDITDLLRKYLAGTLPKHSSAELHDQIHQEYNHDRLLNQFIDSTLLDSARKIGISRGQGEGCQ